MFEISHMRSNLQTPEKFNLCSLLCPQARTSLLCSGNARISSFIVRLVINFTLSAQASGIKPEPADTHNTHCSYFQQQDEGGSLTHLHQRAARHRLPAASHWSRWGNCKVRAWLEFTAIREESSTPSVQQKHKGNTLERR